MGHFGQTQIPKAPLKGRRNINMDSLKDYEFEYFEKYFGDATQVQDTMENCPHCGEKLYKFHQANFKELFTKETSRCNSCDYGQKKILHKLN